MTSSRPRRRSSPPGASPACPEPALTAAPSDTPEPGDAPGTGTARRDEAGRAIGRACYCAARHRHHGGYFAPGGRSHARRVRVGYERAVLPVSLPGPDAATTDPPRSSATGPPAPRVSEREARHLRILGPPTSKRVGGPARQPTPEGRRASLHRTLPMFGRRIVTAAPTCRLQALRARNSGQSATSRPFDRLASRNAVRRGCLRRCMGRDSGPGRDRPIQRR